MLILSPPSQAQQVNISNSILDSLYKASAGHLNNYEYKEAIDDAMHLLQLAKSCDNYYYHHLGHNILGTSYYEINDTLRAKRHYEDALVYAQKEENDTLILGAFNNLGNIYSEDINTTQIGIDYYNLVINLATKINHQESIFNPTVNIAWTYIDNGKYARARPYLAKAWELFGEKDDPLIKSQLLFLMGRYYIGIKEPEQAQSHFEEAIDIVEESSLILQASHVYEEYAKLLSSRGKFEEAFHALTKFNHFKSKIFEQDRIRQIETANAKFDVNEYQQNLEKAKSEQILKDEVIERSREKVLIMVISSIVLLIILLALYKINTSRKKLIAELSRKNEELIQAKEEAERLSILKTRFFSTISHELRTPLYGVIGLASILLEDKTLAKHESDLKSLKFSADYLLALINDVLQMNKMESNLVKLENVPLKLDVLMKSIVKSFEFTRLQNKNDIYLDLDPDIPSNLKGDPVRLSQVLMNLVGNAMKFTERGNIWISTTRMRELEDSVLVKFEIKDDGLGIPKNKQKIIFEEFSQLKSDNYNYQGTGLGLPIVKKLLNLFGSEVHLESEENSGSVFSFAINFSIDHNVAATEVLQLEKSGLSDLEDLKDQARGKYILIVDDNRINQVVTQRILEQHGFLCDICDNGTEAVEKVKNQNYDLVLMDVNMPGITGLEATRRIREFNSFIPIVALTAVEIEEIREKILEAGMNDIIVKPYDNSVFYQVVYRNIPNEMVT